MAEHSKQVFEFLHTGNGFAESGTDGKLFLAKK